jgi:DNA repair photolyase
MLTHWYINLHLDFHGDTLSEEDKEALRKAVKEMAPSSITRVEVVTIPKNRGIWVTANLDPEIDEDTATRLSKRLANIAGVRETHHKRI